MIGLINAVMAAPVMISYATIIFRDPFFRPYMPSLIKLVLFSAIVHQACFALWSSLPFAIGQVQDAGLIFLSAMATSVVHKLHEEPPAAAACRRAAPRTTPRARPRWARCW